MENFKKFILTILLTSSLSLIILSVVSEAFIPKWIDHDTNMMTYIVKGFYKEEKNSLDVVFLGNSDTYRGVDPLVLYNDYGIASYNFVSAGQRMWGGYAMFLETLRTQNPKIIMFNVDQVYFDDQTSDGNNGKIYDNLPFNYNKLISVYDKNYEAKDFRRLAHLLPILEYHNRYNEMTLEDIKSIFQDYHYSLKGMDMLAYQVPALNSENYMDDVGEKMTISERNVSYLEKMRKLCAKKGIEFILFHTPSTDSASYAKYLGVEEYAKKYNVPYLELNLVNEEIGINWQYDTSDGGDHLNMFGAEKVSKYLGQYLKENYDLPDRRKDKKYENWQKDYEIYLKTREEEIEIAKKINRYIQTDN